MSDLSRTLHLVFGGTELHREGGGRRAREAELESATGRKGCPGEAEGGRARPGDAGVHTPRPGPTATKQPARPGARGAAQRGPPRPGPGSAPERPRSAGPCRPLGDLPGPLAPWHRLGCHSCGRAPPPSAWRATSRGLAPAVVVVLAGSTAAPEVPAPSPRAAL